jgi:hypothetical protein
MPGCYGLKDPHAYVDDSALRMGFLHIVDSSGFDA